MHGPTSDDNCPTDAGYRRRDRAPSRRDPAWTCDASRVAHTAAHADRPIEHGAPTLVFTGPMRCSNRRSAVIADRRFQMDPGPNGAKSFPSLRSGKKILQHPNFFLGVAGDVGDLPSVWM